MSYSADLQESLRAGFRLISRGLKDLNASLKADGLMEQAPGLINAEMLMDQSAVTFEMAVRGAAKEASEKLADSMRGYDSQETT